MAHESNHPLEQTLARLRALSEDFGSDCGPCEGDWFLASNLTERPDALEAALARAAQEHPELGAKTNATFFLGDYSWYVPTAAIACYLAEARVPDLNPSRLALRYSTFTWHEGDESGTSERLDSRFVRPTFSCLPGDPDAAHPDARVVQDAAALRETLRLALEAHFRPLIETLYARSRLGKRALWNLAADSVAGIFLEMGERLGRSEAAQREGEALVQAEASAFKNARTGYFTLHVLGHTETFRARGGCCRYYTLPGGDYCSTCVHRSPEERDAKFVAYLTEKYS